MVLIRHHSWQKLLLYIFLIILAVVTLFPFYIMVIMGTYYSNDLFKGIVVLPSNYLMENLKTVFGSGMLRYYFNSTYISATVAVFGIFISSLAGFAFAKYNFKFKHFLFALVLAIMMVPKQLGLVAFIWQMRIMGISGTHLPLILPNMASSFGVFWLTQNIKGFVPDSVLESARIEGCSEFKTYYLIVLPFIKPALLSLGLLEFIWNWNEYIKPLLLISKLKLYTVPLATTILSDLYRIDYGAQLLALTISTIPLIALFLLFSKSLIQGMVGAAVKG